MRKKVEKLHPTTNVEYARAYARRGWLVLPIWPIKANGRCACNSDDCIRPGKHPAVNNGVKDASKDIDQIDDWWEANPQYGIGIATGKESGITGLDIDVSNGKQGDVALNNLRGKEAMPDALCVETPTKGRHYYFAYTPNIKTAKEPFGESTDIDTRNDNGYLIAPPSAHVVGGVYRWLSDNWRTADLPEWPDWLAKPEPKEEKTGAARTRERFDPRNPKQRASLLHALKFIDPANYDKWIKVGFILGRAFQWNDDGFAVYSEWSASAGAAYEHKKTHGIYYKDSRKPPKKPLTTASIFEWAQENDAYSTLVVEVERAFQIIDDKTDIPAVADELARIAANSMAIYKRNGELVFLSDGLAIARHTPKTMMLELSRHVSYLTPTEKGLKAGPVPEQMAAMVLERKTSDAKPLIGVSHFPVFRPDWSIACETGYDEATGIWVDCPEAITPLLDGIGTLRQLVSEFPWATPVDESVFFAALFTVGLRHLFPTAPLFGFSAYAAGSGKSLLCDVISTIWYGKRAPKSFWPEKEEEMSKTIVANLLGGGGVIVFDNIDRGEKVHDAVLCAMLTADTVKMRILGKSEVVEVDTHVAIMATGNDLTFTGDTARRAMLCTIDVPDSTPDRRTGFKHPDLLDYILAHRSALLGCALGAILKWVKGGRKPGAYRKGSFEMWSSVVSGIIEANGLTPLSEYNNLASGGTDEAAEAEAEFLELLSHTLFADVDAIYTTVELSQRILANSELRDAFKQIYPQVCFGELRKDRMLSTVFEINPTSVGKVFIGLNGRWRGVQRRRVKENNPPPKGRNPPPLPPNPPPFVETTELRVVLKLNRKTKQRRWCLEEK